MNTRTLEQNIVEVTANGISVLVSAPIMGTRYVYCDHCGWGVEVRSAQALRTAGQHVLHCPTNHQ